MFGLPIFKAMYEGFSSRIEANCKAVGRGCTLIAKIWFAHLGQRYATCMFEAGNSHALFGSGRANIRHAIARPFEPTFKKAYKNTSQDYFNTSA